MITVYETAYYGPTENRGSRIKVTNRWTGKSKWHYWDYSVNDGIYQHQFAVRECARGDLKNVHVAGDTKRGWLFAVETEAGYESD
jgi:hypothetical protein